MRVLLYYLILIVLLVSCNSKIEPKLNQIEGTWNLENIQFEDLNGEITDTVESNIVLEFTTELPNGSKADGVRLGAQHIDGKAYPFEYSIDFSQHKIDFLFKELDKSKLSANAIGRVQVYQFEMKDKNTFKLSSDIEFDYEKNVFEPRKNVFFEFIRK